MQPLAHRQLLRRQLCIFLGRGEFLQNVQTTLSLHDKELCSLEAAAMH